MGPIYLYVDGESHYIRTENAWKKTHGAAATLDLVTVSQAAGYEGNLGRKPGGRFLHQAKAKFFWDRGVTLLADKKTVDAKFQARFPDGIDRAVYFTACAGTPEDRHEAKVTIRKAGFEPYVIEEPGDLEQRRAHRRTQNSILTKPKGVDIALSVRMLDDAYHGNYHTCCLFTSDSDFLPVIEAVRRMGKRVIVFGFRDAIGKQSPLLYVVERFIDLGGEYMKTQYALARQSP